MELRGGGGGWFWGKSPIGGLNSGGEVLQLTIIFHYLYVACKALLIGTA